MRILRFEDLTNEIEELWLCANTLTHQRWHRLFDTLCAVLCAVLYRLFCSSWKTPMKKLMYLNCCHFKYRHLNVASPSALSQHLAGYIGLWAPQYQFFRQIPMVFRYNSHFTQVPSTIVITSNQADLEGNQVNGVISSSDRMSNLHLNYGWGNDD